MLRECEKSIFRRARHTPPRDSILSSGPSRAPAPYRCRPSPWWDAAPQQRRRAHIPKSRNLPMRNPARCQPAPTRRSLHRPPPYTRTFRARNGRHRKKPPRPKRIRIRFLDPIFRPFFANDATIARLCGPDGRVGYAPMRKVWASRGRMPANGRAGKPDGKCCRKENSHWRESR